MRVEELELVPVEVPLRMRFRRVESRRAVLVGGPAGWGEFSPFPEYPPSVAVRWWQAAVEAATTPFPPPRRSRIPVNVTVPGTDPHTAFRLVVESGCGAAKVKVAEPGGRFEDDLARVAAVREALGEDGALRVDANGAWSVDEAEERLRRLDDFRLEYVEQPCATLPELVELRRRISLPVAVDEGVRLAEHPLQVVEAGGCDLVVLKVQPLGGVSRVLELAASAGVPVVLSSALETSVGLAAGLAAAAALSELSHHCGLGTALLLAGDVVPDPLTPVDGSVEVRRPSPDEELTARWRPHPEVEQAMLERVREVAAWEARR